MAKKNTIKKGYFNPKYVLATFTKTVIYTVCTGLFLIVMSNIWLKFQEGYTTTNLRLRDDGEKRKKLPCISICAVPPFKQKGANYTFSNTKIFF